MGRRWNNTLDTLELFSSVIMVLLLVVLLVSSISYWSSEMISLQMPLNMRLFSIALIITIVTVILQWIEGRIEAIVRLVNGGENWQRRKKTQK